MFVAYGAPNPFRDQVNVTFALPRSGRVRVEVYGADGRHVQTLVNREFAAGSHSIPWKVDQGVKSGMYFYKVLAGDNESTGKLTRVD